jgi:putative ABC transport system permease protein
MSWIGETRYTLRVLGRNRGYTTVAALTLALSIGANTAIFSMADAIVNRPFPFPDLPRVVSIASTIPRTGTERYAVSPADYVDMVERNRSFQALAAYRSWDARLTGAGEAWEVRAASVSPSFFAMLGMAPLAGRVFDERAAEAERNHVVVSYGFWQERLGADPAAVGSSLELNGIEHTIVGMMPRSFDFPMSTDVWTPWIATPEEARGERAAGQLNVIGRLRPRVPLEQARAEMSSIAADLAARYPSSNRGRDAGVMQLSEAEGSYARRYVAVVAAAVTFLLILACANVANLQLAQGTMRQSEMALRMALGGSAFRIARQLLLQGVVLSLAGAGLGVPLASFGLRVTKNHVPRLVAQHLPGLQYAGLDSRTLGWMLLAAVLTGIVFTLPAALQISPGRAHEVLKDGGRGQVRAGGGRLRSALVVAEVAFAVVLVVVGTLMWRSALALTASRKGFQPGGVLTFRLRAPEFQYPGEAQATNLYRETLRRLNTLGGVEAAVVSTVPAIGGSNPAAVLVEGQQAPPPENPLMTEMRIASEGYFRTLGIPLAAGRDFADSDDAYRQPVAVISKAAAARFWPRRNALGRRLQLVISGRRTAWLTVVGIAGDINHFFLDAEIRPTVYVPYRQFGVRSMNVILKPAAGAQISAAAVREMMAGIDRSQPAYDLDRLARWYEDLTGGVRLMASLIGIIALLALIFAATGVYAVMHYAVSRRTQEIGIRMSLGATPGEIQRMVLASALRLVAVALAMGLPATWWLVRAMSAMMAGIVVVEPVVLLGAGGLVAGAATLASWRPASRATRVDPMTAMKAV